MFFFLHLGIIFSVHVCYFVVFYIFTESQGARCSVNLKISCDIYKLTRIFQVIKKKNENTILSLNGCQFFDLERVKQLFYYKLHGSQFTIKQQ